MTRRSSQLTIGFSSAWKKQSAWDVPMINSDIDKAFPATSRNYIDTEETVEEVTDCTGEDFLFEITTAEIARLTLDFDVDTDLLNGLMYFAKGVALAPSGGTSEVQTETVTATGGTRTLTVQVGANAQTTAPIAYNANAAAIQAALEALSNVEPGDILVTGTGPYVYTFAQAFALQDVNLISIGTHFLTGGTSTIVSSTPGVGQTHLISRVVSYALPLLTLYVGFRGSDKQPLIFKNVVVDSIRVRSASREKVTATVVFVGSADLQYATGYTMPACYDIIPIRFGDCKMSIAGVDYIAQNLGREFEYSFQNNVNPKFDGSGIYATRHERADQRPTSFTFYILGEPGDALYNIGKAKTTLETFLQLGPTGKHTKIIAPQGFIKLMPTPIRFGGDPAESEICLIVRPKKTSGDSTTPVTVTAVSGQATTYGTAA